MTDHSPTMDDSKRLANELKLYSLLVDQLLKYQATIWQIPTALVIGNFLAIEKFLKQPIPLLALASFNFGLIFVLYRMIKSQRRIIEATNQAESKLRPIFGDLLPTFNKHKWPAPYVFVGILSALETGLVAYIVVLLLTSTERFNPSMTSYSLISGFLFSTLVGAFFIWLIIEKLAWPYVLKHHQLTVIKKPHSLTVWIGIVERALFTSTVLMGAAAFIPLWIAIKVAPHWERWKGDERVVYNVFLLGNGLSIIFGLLGAWIAYGLPNNPFW